MADTTYLDENGQPLPELPRLRVFEVIVGTERRVHTAHANSIEEGGVLVFHMYAYEPYNTEGAYTVGRFVQHAYRVYDEMHEVSGQLAQGSDSVS